MLSAIIFKQYRVSIFESAEKYKEEEMARENCHDYLYSSCRSFGCEVRTENSDLGMRMSLCMYARTIVGDFSITVVLRTPPHR